MLGDVVTGRTIEVNGVQRAWSWGKASEVTAGWPLAHDAAGNEAAPGKADLSALTSMLQARWKGGSGTSRHKRSRCVPGRSGVSVSQSWTRGQRRIELL